MNAVEQPVQTETGSYYSDYWRHRLAIGKIHTREGMWIPKRLQVAVEMIDPADHPFSVLDLGCGEGTLGMLLRRRFGGAAQATGCDISPEAVAIAREHYQRVQVLEFGRDAVSRAVGRRRFDYIVCLEVLEHLFDPLGLLQNLTPLIRPRTVLVASFPNFAWWKYRLDLLRGVFPQGYTMHSHTEHLQHFTVASFTELLAAAGWRVVDMDGQFVYPRLLKAILPWRFQRGFGRRFATLFGNQIVMKAVRADGAAT